MVSLLKKALDARARGEKPDLRAGLERITFSGLAAGAEGFSVIALLGPGEPHYSDELVDWSVLEREREAALRYEAGRARDATKNVKTKKKKSAGMIEADYERYT